MHAPEWFTFCRCQGTQICPFCQVLALTGVALISCLLGYWVGKGKKEKPSSKT